MGLYIHLTVQLQHIDSRAWEKAYDESLLLLQRFPAPLIRFKACEIGEYHRYQTTDKIVCDLGSVKERWEVDVLWAEDQAISFPSGVLDVVG